MLFLIFLFLLANHIIIINTETVAADNLKPEETYTHIRQSYKNIYICISEVLYISTDPVSNIIFYVCSERIIQQDFKNPSNTV